MSRAKSPAPRPRKNSPSLGARELSPWKRAIELYRLRENVSTRALAQKAGIQPSTLHAWMTGTARVPPPGSYTPEVNAALAHALGCSPSELGGAYVQSLELPIPAEILAPPNKTVLNQIIEILSARSGRFIERHVLIELLEKIRGE